MLRLSLVLCDDPPELHLRTLDVEDGAEDTVLRAISVLPGTSEPPVWFYWSDFFDPNHRSGFNLWQFVHVERQRGFLPFLEHTAEIGEDERLEDLEDGPAFLETQFIVGLVRETVQGFFQHGLETLNVVDETNLALHQRIRLRNVLVHNTSMDELQGWVFDLGLEWENLEGPAKPSRTVALLTELEHRGRLGDLVALVRRDRPDLSFSHSGLKTPAPTRALVGLDRAEVVMPAPSVGIAATEGAGGMWVAGEMVGTAGG